MADATGPWGGSDGDTWRGLGKAAGVLVAAGAAVCVGVYLGTNGLILPTWVMFLVASQYVMVRFRDEEFSALQFAMLFMMVSWQSLWSILAVAIAVVIYEIITIRVWFKAFFNVLTQTATYGLALAVYHAVDYHFTEWWGPVVGLGAAVGLAGLTQELFMSMALWIPIRLTPKEWFSQEKWEFLSLSAATVGTALMSVWPPMLLVGLGIVISIPLAGSFKDIIR